VHKNKRAGTGDADPLLKASKEQRLSNNTKQIANQASIGLSEQQIHKAVFQNIRARGAPDLFAFHPANGGFRKPIEAAILKGLGVVAGVPDIILIHQGRVFALELKRVGGRSTPKQLETIAAMGAAGAFCCVAEGLDRALAVLEMWQLLKGRVS
jgi:hypothetical protein